jgi:hypothetical protein
MDQPIIPLSAVVDTIEMDALDCGPRGIPAIGQGTDHAIVKSLYNCIQIANASAEGVLGS